MSPRLLDRLLSRPQPGEAGDPGSAAEHQPAAEDDLPFPGYDRLDDKEVGARLPGLSQVDLAAVEAYERSHRNRPAVLAKLRYMRTPEPLPDYDALAPEQIIEALAGADTETVKAVRGYERKFGRRPRVLDEAARVLPESAPSARESRAHEENAARVSEGVAGRAQIAGRLASRRSTPPPAGS